MCFVVADKKCQLPFLLHLWAGFLSFFVILGGLAWLGWGRLGVGKRFFCAKPDID